MNNLFTKHKYATTFFLSFSSGFIDVATFISLSGLFTSHITGNLAEAAASIIENKEFKILSHLVVILFFILGIFSGCIAAEYANKTHKQVITFLLFSESFFLLLFLITGYYFHTHQPYIKDENMIIQTVFPAAVAMGIQSSMMRESKIKILPTTAMTGNLTLFFTDLYSYFRIKIFKKKDSGFQEIEYNLKTSGTLLGGFIFGASSGAAGMIFFHFWSILLPLSITFVLSLVSLRIAGTKNN
jgi:uncharacterized membrane protein YoaK (UPF0700 family)